MVVDLERCVGRRLAGARLHRGLSQGTVARLARIAPSYLSRIETGKVQPTLRTVLRIAGALRVPVETLLAGVGPRERGGHPPCPVTASGDCLIDLIRLRRGEPEGADAEFFTPRQIQLLRRFAAWLRRVPPSQLGAVEVVLQHLLGDVNTASSVTGAPGARPRVRTPPGGATTRSPTRKASA